MQNIQKKKKKKKKGKKKERKKRKDKKKSGVSVAGKGLEMVGLQSEKMTWKRGLEGDKYPYYL